MEIKLQKSKLEVFYKVLKETQGVLSLSDSRIRDSFMKPLGEQLDIFIKNREDIYKKFCEKNEDGTPNTEDNKYKFLNEDLDEINKELLTLANEEVIITYPFGVSNSKLKEFIDVSNYKPQIGEAELIINLLS